MRIINLIGQLDKFWPMRIINAKIMLIYMRNEMLSNQWKLFRVWLLCKITVTRRFGYGARCILKILFSQFIVTHLFARSPRCNTSAYNSVRSTRERLHYLQFRASISPLPDWHRLIHRVTYHGCNYIVRVQVCQFVIYIDIKFEQEKII